MRYTKIMRGRDAEVDLKRNKKNYNSTLMKTIKFILSIIAIVMMIDVMGFLAWVYSGQRPVDDFYIGTITTHIVRAIADR